MQLYIEGTKYNQNSQRRNIGMKLKLLTILTAALLFAGMSSAYAVVLMDEATFVGFSTGKSTYVDYYVTDEGPVITPGSYTFNFIHGDATAYTDDSIWYYYYQIENPEDVSIVAFSLNIFPVTVLSAGWIDGVDLDAAPFNHTVAMEHELSGSPAVSGPTSPADASFNPGGIAPNVSYDFDSPTNNLTKNEFSTVLFISCKFDPTFKFSTMQNGETFNGSLPVPTSPLSIPEPMSMILFGGSIVGLVIKKRK